MRIAQDARFREERARFELRFGCEDCAIFEPSLGACAHGYPTSEHREKHYEDPDAPLVFCKEWECA